MARRPVLLTMVLAFLLTPASASAYDPPELFVRTWNFDAGARGPWIPLSPSPTIDFIGGVQIGYRVQAGDRQDVGVKVTGVPDGVVTQPRSTPFCGIAGITPGAIESVQEPAIEYEGNGAYSVSVSIGPNRNAGPQDCFTGPTSTASFTVASGVTPEIVGRPVARETQDPFAGARAPDPPGGQGHVVCALNAAVGADGALSGKFLNASDVERSSPLRNNFDEPGPWSCVARGGIVRDINANFDQGLFTTPWSAPVRVNVRIDFRRKGGQVNSQRSRRPTIQFDSEYPVSTAGLGGKLVLKKFVRCRGAKPVGRRGQTVTGKFDAKGRIKLKATRPRDGSLYYGYLTAVGGDFLRDHADPKAVLVGQKKGKFGFLDAPPSGRCLAPAPRITTGSGDRP